MKLLGILVLLLLAIPIRADQIDYTLTVQNAPGGIGDFSWTLAHDGFIEVTPAEFDDSGNCTNCNRYNFNSFVSVSPPSKGGGCGISGVFLDPEYAPTTFFSPLCTGGYDGFVGGGFPTPPDQLGTWTWQGTSPDNTQNFVTLTISDPPTQTPEPQTWAMLWIGLIGLALMKFAARGQRLKSSLPWCACP